MVTCNKYFKILSDGIFLLHSSLPGRLPYPGFVPMQVSNKSRFAEFKWKINFAQQLLSCHDFEKYKAAGWRFSYLELYTNECIHTLEQKKKSLCEAETELLAFCLYYFMCSILIMRKIWKSSMGKTVVILKCYFLKLCEIN